MKKGLILLLAVFTLVSLFGCTAPATPTVTVTPPPQTVTPPPVTKTVTPPATTVAPSPPPATVTSTPLPPTPTPGPSPTPQIKAGYSREYPAALNTPLDITIDKFFAQSGDAAEYSVRLSLSKFLRGADAWRVIEASNEYNPRPPDGYEYILVTLVFQGPVARLENRPATVFDVRQRC
jgi:hypothetical protein